MVFRLRKGKFSYCEQTDDVIFQLIDVHTDDLVPRDIDSESDNEDDPNSWEVIKNRIDHRVFAIYLFGVTLDGQSVCVSIPDFPVYFYIKLIQNWSREKIAYFINSLQNKCYSIKEGPDWIRYTYGQAITKTSTVTRKELYGFTNNKLQKFLRINMKNYSSMKRLSNRLQKGDYQLNSRDSTLYSFDIFEANIEPIIRFFHCSGILPGGWVKIPKGKYSKCSSDNPNSYCQKDISCKWKVVTSADNLQVPDSDKIYSDCIAPIRQASFDIECYSVDGSVPTPDVKGNRIIQIATTMCDYGSYGNGNGKETYKHIITLGPCPDIDGAKVVSKKKEKDVILTWAKLLRKADIHFLTGYNIFWFDLHYIWERAKKLGCVDEFSKCLGKLVHFRGELKTKNLESKAYGSNCFRMLSMPGILQVDLYPYIRKEKKYSSYKLDYVAEKILGEKKHDISPKQIFEYYASQEPDKIKQLAEYCIQDTLLPQRIIDKEEILPILIEMARACCVPMNYIVTRGQTIRVFSLIAKKARESGYLIKTLPYNRPKEQEGYQGATVLSAKKGAYLDDPVTGLDFKSLYPTIMIDHNFCYTTFVTDTQYADLPNQIYETIHVDNRTYLFNQTNRGILPAILEHLLQARGVAKKQMAAAKKAGDKLKYSICNGRQLALKVSCNSVYGFTGATIGALPCNAIAESVTAVGRKMIEDSKNYAENVNNFPDWPHYKGTHVVYGDTDSIYVCFNTRHLSTPTEKIEYSMKIGKYVSERITEFLRSKNPFLPDDKKWTELEYEKVYYPFILFAKKRYIGNMYEFNPNAPEYTDNKGIVLTRRDNCLYVKEVYNAVIKILFDDSLGNHERRLQLVFDKLTCLLEDLIDNKVPLEKLTISKTLKKDYVNEKSQPHFMLAQKMRKRDPGSAPRINDRVKYAIIEHPDPKALQAVKAEDPDYIDANNLPLDVGFYITNQLQKPIESLLVTLTDNYTQIFENALRKYNLKRKGPINSYFQSVKSDSKRLIPSTNKKKLRYRNTTINNYFKQH